MAKKKQSLESKLGSWTDQATLTRTHTPEAEPRHDASRVQAEREAYAVERSLIDRIADTAEQHGMTHNELVDYLSTWSLDQVDRGAHTIARER